MRLAAVTLLAASLCTVARGLQFADVTKASGVEFTHVDGRSGRKYFLETLGSGAAFFDYDGDGDPDLYLVNGAPLPGYVSTTTPTNHLYRNDGTGRFADVTASAGVGDTGYGHGACVGDYDADGDLDLYVTNFGPNVLYQNNGDGTFTDVTALAGVALSQWSSSAAFADYDLDGDLDLYVANYIEFSIDDNPWCGLRERDVRAYCAPDQFTGHADVLLRNDGDGTFTDVTHEADVYNVRGKGLGIAWGDYDLDGYPDIYVANDSTENFLYRNLRDGTFEEVAFMTGVALGENGDMENGMGVAWGDYDNDGLPDLTVTNYADQTNTLYHNDGDGFFADVTVASTTGYVTDPYLGWATAFMDYDNDGDVDLFVANGHLHDNLGELGQAGTYAQRNLLFRNDGGGMWSEVGESLGPALSVPNVSRGAAFADVDLDGDLDMLVTNSNAPARLLRNDGGSEGAWLVVDLRRANGEAGAIGARVRVTTTYGDQWREVRSGSGYLSQHALSLHFGLGDADHVEALAVHWPGGDVEEHVALPANTRLVVSEGATWHEASTDGAR
jgi:hypothetical protein